MVTVKLLYNRFYLGRLSTDAEDDWLEARKEKAEREKLRQDMANEEPVSTNATKHAVLSRVRLFKISRYS